MKLFPAVLRTCRKIFAPAGFYLKKRDPAWAMPLILPDSDNLYCLNANLFRSAQPTARAFTEYEKLGIKTVLQLRPDKDDEPLIAHTALRLLVVPMKTADIRDAHVIEALRLIRTEPGPILMHCRHGADRTGLVAALYRMLFDGFSRKAALNEMLHGGYGFHHRKRQNIVDYLNNADIETIRANVARA